MKVDVLTINEVTVPKWRWWSNWIDVAVFNYGSCGYLLQMKINRRNLKRFKVVAFKSPCNLTYATTGEVGDLLQMNGNN